MAKINFSIASTFMEKRLSLATHTKFSYVGQLSLEITLIIKIPCCQCRKSGENKEEKLHMSPFLRFAHN